MEELPKINVLYEDNHIIVVEKKPGILVQADDTNDIDLLTIIKKYLKIKYNKPGNVYVGLVHRLDRPVGGVMIFAKTSKAASRLSESIRNGDIKKIYFAVVENHLKNKDTWIDYLIKDSKNNIVKITTKDKGKEAILDYQVLEEKDNLSLVKINLHTGRSHQIRVQFSSHGHPLYGDKKYNKKAIPNVDIALFAKELTIIHPVTKEKMTFTLELPNKKPFNLFRNHYSS